MREWNEPSASLGSVAARRGPPPLPVGCGHKEARAQLRTAGAAPPAAAARNPPAAAPPRPPLDPRNRDQLARCKDRLRVDIGHLSHPVYGAPELATALVENPAEYLPIVSPRLAVSASCWLESSCGFGRWADGPPTC